MGVHICQMCNEHINFDDVHVCNPDKIKAYVSKLEEDVRDARNKLESMQNAVFMLVQELPSLGTGAVCVDTKWVRQLWLATNCHWYKVETVDDFHVQWLATHRVLCEAFDVFRAERLEHSRTLLQKLTDLKEACAKAAELMYPDSGLIITPEELVMDCFPTTKDAPDVKWEEFN